MSLIDKVVKIEKRLEKLAERKDAIASPLEIRRAILDDVEEHVQPAGRSRRVFPYDRLLVEAFPPTGDRAALEAVLNPDEGLVDAIRERLHEAGCARIGRLQVAVKIVKKARPDWPRATFQVTYGRSDAPAEGATPAASESTSATRQTQIVVLEGEAAKKTFTVSGERINIGRLAEVTDRQHRVVRRNQVVFLETDADSNQTISRAHAHIQFTAPNDYRLFDDHSSYGTRIVRDGRMIDLPSGSPRGVKLQSGDEIHLGRARVQFIQK